MIFFVRDMRSETSITGRVIQAALYVGEMMKKRWLEDEMGGRWGGGGRTMVVGRICWVRGQERERGTSESMERIFFFFL